MAKREIERKSSKIIFNTRKINLDSGIRFQYNYVLEEIITKEFYNNPLSGFIGKDMIAFSGDLFNYM